MTTELMRRELPPALLEQIQAIAPMVHASRLFGVASPEQAATIMIKGAELGLPPTAAFEMIHLIQGKPSISPRGALALVYQCGLLESMEITEKPDVCTVTMKRRGGFSYTASWSIDDAKRAGLWKKDGAWEMYPANMMRWRAIGFVLDVLFPDVLAGLKTADQYGASLSLEGDVIEAEVV